jgi:hypothetical protein
VLISIQTKRKLYVGNAIAYLIDSIHRKIYLSIINNNNMNNQPATSLSNHISEKVIIMAKANKLPEKLYFHRRILGRYVWNYQG